MIPKRPAASTLTCAVKDELSRSGLSQTLHILFYFQIDWLIDWLIDQAEEGPREREKERIPSRLCIVSAQSHVGLKLTNHEMVTWPEVWSLTDWATQVPQHSVLLMEKWRSGKITCACYGYDCVCEEKQNPHMPRWQVDRCQKLKNQDIATETFSSEITGKYQMIKIQGVPG